MVFFCRYGSTASSETIYIVSFKRRMFSLCPKMDTSPKPQCSISKLIANHSLQFKLSRDKWKVLSSLLSIDKAR